MTRKNGFRLIFGCSPAMGTFTSSHDRHVLLAVPCLLYYSGAGESRHVAPQHAPTLHVHMSSLLLTDIGARIPPRVIRNIRAADHSALIPAARMTLPHFSVSS